MAKRVAFHTLGCKLNFSETSTIARKFRQDGYDVVKFKDEADIYVINSCTVTDQADKKCRQAIARIQNNNPKAKIAIVGCYAQVNADELASIDGVNLILGSKEKYDILDYLKENKQEQIIHSCEIKEVDNFLPAHSETDRTRSFLKIQDGCDYQCTYCAIPLARGKSRNQSIKKIVEEANEIAAHGTKEIVLTGVNIGDFGKSTEEKLIDLLKKLDKVNGIERYRISSVEPNLLTDEIIDFVKTSNKFLPHFHIPLQSGCNEILKRMRRRYMKELFKERIIKIKNTIPDAFIGVDVIVGFPGETNELFRKTFEFAELLDVSFYHVFSYSERPNTATVGMDHKIPKSIIHQRSKLLQELADLKLKAFTESQIGTTRDVLFEAYKKGNKIFGFTDNYIKTETIYNKDLIGDIKKFKLNFLNEQGNVEGKILN